MAKEENKCYPCNGLGYHIEACIEADGTTNRVKVSCSCCDGTGEAKEYGIVDGVIWSC